MCIKDIRKDLCDKEEDCDTCKYRNNIGFVEGDYNWKIPGTEGENID